MLARNTEPAPSLPRPDRLRPPTPSPEPPMSLFPHHKLDWNVARLEKHVEDNPDDHGARTELAATWLSRAAFHGEGEPAFTRALGHARRVIQNVPSSAEAHGVAAGCLVGMDRLDAAQKHVEDALELDDERADVHYVAALWHRAFVEGPHPKAFVGQAGDDGAAGADHRQRAIRELEAACRLAPDAWEPHALLATMLWERVGAAGGAKRATRLVERSQYHTTRALELGPPPAQAAPLLFHLGMTCLVAEGDRIDAATKLFTRLLDDEVYRPRAQYHLGLVNYQVGRYKNAILYLRQHLEHLVATGAEAASAKVHSRIAMAHLKLGEVVKARESCNRALAIDPNEAGARWTLACALASEGRDDEAMRTFKGILTDNPENGPAFSELVRLRRQRADVGWLTAALRAEVKGFDRLPVTLQRAEGTLQPRATTRQRIAVLLSALYGDPGPVVAGPHPGRGGAASPDDAVVTVLDALDLTTDESVRFQLWEGTLDHLTAVRAEALTERLATPGRLFSAQAGREVLALARGLPEGLLVQALQIDEEDLRRAAVERHGPTSDVGAHRQAIDVERREARAWQALVLLAIASHDNRASRNLLVRWAAEADADLADAARAALVMLGDEESAEILSRRARARGAGNLVEAMRAQVVAPTLGSGRVTVRPASAGEDVACSTCGRRPSDVTHLMVGGAGGSAALCSVCLAEIAMHRRELEVDDPDAVCALSGRGRFETAAMYQLRDVTVSREVVDHGLGLLEREAVDRYLGAL